MRVLLLLGPARPADQGAHAPAATRLLAGLAGAGIAAETSRAILPDLSGYDLAHLLAASPVERAARQFLHARRWGCPVAISVVSQPDTLAGTDPPRRYEAALRALLLRGADGTIVLDRSDGAGATYGERYGAIVQERARMADENATAAGQWLPGVPPEEYGRHLEDLCQLQLELIAYRDAEYERLRRRLADGADEPDAGHRALQAEYERLGEWSRELEARHEAVQADYARLRHWAGELEAQLRSARSGGLRGRVARLLRRG